MRQWSKRVWGSTCTQQPCPCLMSQLSPRLQASNNVISLRRHEESHQDTRLSAARWPWQPQAIRAYSHSCDPSHPSFSLSSICLLFPSPPHSITLIIPLFESLTVEIIYLTQIRLIINPSSPSTVWFVSEVRLCLRVIKNAWVSDSVSGPRAASRGVVNYPTYIVLMSGIISDASLIIFSNNKKNKHF